jgi:hypothetical protein
MAPGIHALPGAERKPRVVNTVPLEAAHRMKGGLERSAAHIVVGMPVTGPNFLRTIVCSISVQSALITM